MATPFSFEGSLVCPKERELHGVPVPFLAHAQFDSKVEYVLDLPPASAEQELDFGTIPGVGAKMVAVIYEQGAKATSVLLKINEGAGQLELTPGGFFVFHSPTPSEGITALSVAHRAAGRLRIWIMG